MKGKVKKQTSHQANENHAQAALVESLVHPEPPHSEFQDDLEFKPLRLSDLAYNRIKEAIILLDLAPGDELSEAQLASRFNLGKAPIRSALVRLAQEGLVRAIPQRGYIIAPLTIQDIEDIFELRLLLETAAARKAAGRIDSEQIRRLNDICKVGYKPGDVDSKKAFLQANREFHVTIAHASGNEKLATVVGNVLDEMTRVICLGMSLSNSSEGWQHGHKDTLELLVGGDADEAERIMRLEIESVREKIMMAVLHSPAVTQVHLQVRQEKNGAETGA